MTAPKNWNSFDPTFKELVLGAVATPIKLPMAHAGAARSFAATLRAYIGQVYSADKQQKKGSEDYDARVHDLSMAAQSIMIAVEGAVVNVMPRSMNPKFADIRAMIKEQVGGAGGSTNSVAPDQEAAASFARFEAMMEPDKKDPGATEAARAQVARYYGTDEDKKTD